MELTHWNWFPICEYVAPDQFLGCHSTGWLATAVIHHFNVFKFLLSDTALYQMEIVLRIYGQAGASPLPPDSLASKLPSCKRKRWHSSCNSNCGPPNISSSSSLSAFYGCVVGLPSGKSQLWLEEPVEEKNRSRSSCSHCHPQQALTIGATRKSTAASKADPKVNHQCNQALSIVTSQQS